MKNGICLFCIVTLFSCKGEKEKTIESLDDRAKRIHENTMTVDTHIDINVKNFSDSLNYSQRLDTQVDLPKMSVGGLDVAWLIVYTGQDSLNPNGYAIAKANAMAKFDAIHRLCKKIAPEKIGLALTSDDVRKLYAEGKKVALIGVENAYPMGEDLSNFKKYHELGARYISLAHNGHSQFCDSHTGEADNIWLHNGLSDLGKEAVKEMNKLGIMIDVSHTSKEAMKQMIQLSKAPIIASHSSARAVCDHSRNLDDEQLKLIKENGGVVQTVALHAYLKAEKHAKRTAFIEAIYQKAADSLGLRSQLDTLEGGQREAFYKNHPRIMTISKEMTSLMKEVPPAVNVSDFVDHIDYMVDFMGIDYVGISSDFDGGGGIEGWSDASETFNVTLELVKRGYTESEIAQLWGGNLLRVLDEVQKTAEKLSEG